MQAAVLDKCDRHGPIDEAGSRLAGQPIHRAMESLVRGVGSDRLGQDRLVPGKPLGEADVLGLAVNGRASPRGRARVF